MKYKKIKLLKDRKIPEGIRIIKQEDLKLAGATIENNRIYPEYDSDKFSWEIDFFDYFLNGIKISKQGQKRIDFYDVLAKDLKDIYGSEVLKSSLCRYIKAFSNICENNPQLGIKIIPYDNSKKGAKKFVSSDNIQHFSHQKAIKKLFHANIENLNEDRFQTFLK